MKKVFFWFMVLAAIAVVSIAVSQAETSKLADKPNKPKGNQATESKIKEEIVHKEALQILGIPNYKSVMVKDPKIPPCWDEFFATAAPQEIEKPRAEPGFFGIFINPEIKPPIMKGYYLYLIGAPVSGYKEAPQGMMLYEMPASEYIVLKHAPDADRAGGIGAMAGYLHFGWKPPQGYERYMDNSMFLEFYPPAVDGKFSNEVWAPIRKINKKGK